MVPRLRATGALGSVGRRIWPARPASGGEGQMLDEKDLGNAKQMTIIVTKGSLDWAYPPFILGTTAAAMDVDVTMFFTFYGLPLLKKDLNLKLTTLGNAAMEMPMMGTHIAMPNIVGTLPGVDAAAATMMKNLIKKKGVASIEELREAAIESEIKLIGCQMTLDLFEYERDEMIDEMEIGGAATYMAKALKSDINLFI
jgi:peroxiredoxin family protein